MSNQEKLVEAFVNALNIDAGNVQDSLSYQGIPEWDSISHMILVSEIETIFDVSIDTDDVIDLSSVGKAKEILTKYNSQF
jgi:acyl carrier protein